MTREELKETLIEHQKLYINGVPTIPDWEFDKLVQEYGYEDYIKDIKSSVNTLGADFIHPQLMADILSAEPVKIKLKGEVISDDYSDVTYKLDGSSIISYYINGNLCAISSVGTGYTGKNQTQKLKGKVPQSVDSRITAIRWEAVCAKQDFNNNCRSKANGLINSKYAQSEVDIFLNLIPFNVITKDEMTYTQRMNLIPEEFRYNLIQKNKNEPWVEDTETGKIFPIDGYVLYDGYSVIPKLIYKFYGLEYETSLVTNIEWNESPNGVFVPKLNISKVYISDKAIGKIASGGLQNMIKQGLGVGAKIKVVLSGSTIPSVMEVLSPSRDIPYPTCPHCNREMTPYDIGVKCENRDCLFPSMDKRRETIADFDELNAEHILKVCGVPRISERKMDEIVEDISPPTSDYDDFMAWGDEVAECLSSKQSEVLRSTLQTYYDNYIKETNNE